MIHPTFGNNKDITARTLAAQAAQAAQAAASQAAADRHLLDVMRQAEDEQFHSRREWWPEPSTNDQRTGW